MADSLVEGARPMRVVQIGNGVPEHSTENHLRQAWLNNGHHVDFIQEDDLSGWEAVCDWLRYPDLAPDLVMWTTTSGLAAKIPDDLQRRMLHTALHAGIPSVGYHLDRWWGLQRQHLVHERPWFRCELVVTADGGHDRQWAEAGVNHWWLPPGVSRDEALREPSSRAGRYSQFLVAFVGSWQSYHPEWLPYRQELVNNLKAWYGDRLLLVDGGLRGQGLVDLYRTVPVIVGDSCLAPTADGHPMTRYCSDRLPETIGRGGYLIHPWVEGITDGMYSEDHLMTYRLGNWDDLRGLIATSVQCEPERTAISTAGRAHVLAEHTYERRLEQLVAEMRARKMLPEVTV